MHPPSVRSRRSRFRLLANSQFLIQVNALWASVDSDARSALCTSPRSALRSARPNLGWAYEA